MPEKTSKKRKNSRKGGGKKVTNYKGIVLAFPGGWPNGPDFLESKLGIIARNKILELWREGAIVSYTEYRDKDGSLKFDATVQHPKSKRQSKLK